MVQPAVRMIRVTLTDHSIEPHQISVPANYPIRFVIQNTDSHSHEFAIPHAQYSVDVLPGQTREVVWTFVDVGEFRTISYDDNDAQKGLKGELVVQTLI